MPRPLRIIVVSLVLAGCGGGSAEGPSVPPETAPPQPPLEHTVLECDGNAPCFGGFTIRIPENYHEAQLRQSATSVTRAVRDHYARMQVGFYLPDNNLEGIAWAVANSAPNLSIRINGPSSKESRESVETADNTRADGTLVGQRRNADPIKGGLITITEKDGKLRQRRRCPYDGSELGTRSWLRTSSIACCTTATS